VPITAVHIDHGLHPDSDLWSAHCATHADALGIEFVARQVSVDRGAAQSLEALARDARYAAFAGMLQPGEVLLTAHHADDQLETVLLRMLRGAGVRGLTAVRPQAVLGAGRLARPLLDFTRASILDEARRRGLDWLEDPSNRDPRFDRNFLRQVVLPPLLDRWPQAGPVASRLARQMLAAEAILTEVAAADLGAGADPACIPAAVLTALSPERRSNALRHAIRTAGLPLPTAAQLDEICRMLTVREDAQAEVHWPGAEARMYRQALYLMLPLASMTPPPAKLTPARPLPCLAGELHLVASDDYGIPDRWAQAGLGIVFRQGGERFRPRNSTTSKLLKHWFQEQGVVPWLRNAVPLICHDDTLIGIADLALADGLPQGAGDAPFWRVEWRGRPRLF
jgi:tRNA(Ile)-lysidine synthase